MLIKWANPWALFVIGREPLENGMTILGAHIDSPRLELNRTLYMKILILHCLKPTITEELKSISG